MIRILLTIFAVFYIFSVFKIIVEIAQILTGIHKLNRFISAYDNDYLLTNDNNKYKKQLNSVLRYYPVISKHTFDLWRSLSYSNSDSKNREYGEHFRNDLLMQRNYKMCELKSTVLGVDVVKNILNFPANLLKCFGIKLKKTGQIIINVIGSLLMFAASACVQLYPDEIKEFINSLF